MYRRKDRHEPKHILIERNEDRQTARRTDEIQTQTEGSEVDR